MENPRGWPITVNIGSCQLLSLIFGTTVSAWQAVRASTAESQANANEQKAVANEAHAKEKANEAAAQRDEAQKQRDDSPKH